MFTAITKDGNKLSAAEATLAGKEVFFCPSCGAGVSLRNGLVKIEHFSHHPGNSCEYAGESLLHIKMKSQIFDNLSRLIGTKVKSIELEKLLGNCRPDVFIEGNKSAVAIEVQASSLTPEQILARTARYHDKRISVLWVVPYDGSRITTHGPFPNQEAYRTLKLKEYERIISQMYFKTLVLWNINRPSSMGFVVFKLKDTFTEGADFYDKDWGEHKSFAPKKLKTVKEIDIYRESVQLSDFKPQIVPPFSMPMAKYSLPARNVMTYNWAKKDSDLGT